jgi:predicted DNA-binding protein (MmcQ/YjbR family)
MPDPRQPETSGESGVFERAAFEALVLGLPATTLVRQWGDASVGKVGGKIFAMLTGGTGDGMPAIGFKCSELAFELLTELPDVRPAPYLARAKWVQVLPGSPLTHAEITGYVGEAHRLIAAKLTRRMRADLGISGLIAAPPNRF